MTHKLLLKFRQFSKSDITIRSESGDSFSVPFEVIDHFAPISTDITVSGQAKEAAVGLSFTYQELHATLSDLSDWGYSGAQYALAKMQSWGLGCEPSKELSQLTMIEAAHHGSKEALREVQANPDISVAVERDPEVITRAWPDHWNYYVGFKLPDESTPTYTRLGTCFGPHGAIQVLMDEIERRREQYLGEQLWDIPDELEFMVFDSNPRLGHTPYTPIYTIPVRAVIEMGGYSEPEHIRRYRKQKHQQFERMIAKGETKHIPKRYMMER